MSIIKNIIHATTLPLTEERPYDNGPRTRAKGSGFMARMISKINDASWQPPAALFYGATGKVIAEIGERFPVLNVGDGSRYTVEDAKFCDRLVSVARSVTAGETIEDSLIQHLADGAERYGGGSAEKFLHYLSDPSLPLIGRSMGEKIDAVISVTKSGLGIQEMTPGMWEFVAVSPWEQRRHDGKWFAESLEERRDSYSFGGDRADLTS